MDMNKTAILLCVTKAPTKDPDDGSEITRDIILAHFKTLDEVTAHFKNSAIAEVFTAICQNAIVYHPFADAPPLGWLGREGFLRRLEQMAPVLEHRSTCVVAPTASEMMSVRNLYKSMTDDIDEHIKESQLLEADSLLQLLCTWKRLMFSSQGSAPNMKLLEVEIQKSTDEFANQIKAMIMKEIEVRVSHTTDLHDLQATEAVLECADRYGVAKDRVNEIRILITNHNSELKASASVNKRRFSDGILNKLPLWSPTPSSANGGPGGGGADGVTTVEDDGALRALQTGVTSVVSRDPAVAVSFRIGGNTGAQRNIGFAIGRGGHARAQVTLIAECTNGIHAMTSPGCWNNRIGMRCGKDDVLKLEYKSGKVFFLKNGEEVCASCAFAIAEGEELYAYAYIHHAGGEMLDLSFEPA